MWSQYRLTLFYRTATLEKFRIGKKNLRRRYAFHRCFTYLENPLINPQTYFLLFLQNDSFILQRSN